MALKSLIESGVAGQSVKEMVNDLARLANRYNGSENELDKFIALTSHAGCKVPQTPQNVAALKTITDSIPLPTDAEFAANPATSRFTPDDCNAARKAIKMAAGIQYILDKVANQLPINDV